MFNPDNLVISSTPALRFADSLESLKTFSSTNSNPSAFFKVLFTAQSGLCRQNCIQVGLMTISFHKSLILPIKREYLYSSLVILLLSGIAETSEPSKNILNLSLGRRLSMINLCQNHLRLSVEFISCPSTPSSLISVDTPSLEGNTIVLANENLGCPFTVISPDILSIFMSSL